KKNREITEKRGKIGHGDCYEEEEEKEEEEEMIELENLSNNMVEPIFSRILLKSLVRLKVVSQNMAKFNQ
ncbi:hypothetical protein HAX54_019416, partial [Datura stramonium]|nr:hypothetical protein [Datura stramonium]